MPNKVLDIIEYTEKMHGIKLYPYQKTMLKILSYGINNNVIICYGRGSGRKFSFNTVNDYMVYKTLEENKMNQTAKYEQERVGDYIHTYTGNRFYPLDPRAEDINITDIAHSLSGLPRFTAHSERFYTVGEHSIHCANVAKVMGLSTLQQLYALLHDASESIVNDVNRPTKQNLQEYKDLEDNIMEVIWESEKLPKPSEEDYKLVKIIDNTLLLNEMFQLLPNEGLEIPNVEHELISVDLSTDYTRNDIKGMFLLKYTELMEVYLNEEC